MRAADLVTVDEVAPGSFTPDPRSAVFHRADTLRAVARRLGCKLGRKLLGRPAVSEDAVDR
jgi:hypothetical protein